MLCGQSDRREADNTLLEDSRFMGWNMCDTWSEGKINTDVPVHTFLFVFFIPFIIFDPS